MGTKNFNCVSYCITVCLMSFIHSFVSPKFKQMCHNHSLKRVHTLVRKFQFFFSKKGGVIYSNIGMQQKGKCNTFYFLFKNIFNIARMAKYLKDRSSTCKQRSEKPETLSVATENAKWQNPFKSQLRKILKIPRIKLAINPRKLKVYVHLKTCT